MQYSRFRSRLTEILVHSSYLPLPSFTPFILHVAQHHSNSAPSSTRALNSFWQGRWRRRTHLFFLLLCSCFPCRRVHIYSARKPKDTTNLEPGNNTNSLNFLPVSNCITYKRIYEQKWYIRHTLCWRASRHVWYASKYKSGETFQSSKHEMSSQQRALWVRSVENDTQEGESVGCHVDEELVLKISSEISLLLSYNIS